jgi:hypothetical protein
MERHYCFSCLEWHGFLDADEWSQVEPMWREAQRAAARAGRIAHRLRRPISETEWLAMFGPALQRYTELTGDAISNPHSLYHRQLKHDCKWRPREGFMPPPDSQSSRGAA